MNGKMEKEKVEEAKVLFETQNVQGQYVMTFRVDVPTFYADLEGKLVRGKEVERVTVNVQYRPEDGFTENDLETIHMLAKRVVVEKEVYKTPIPYLEREKYPRYFKEMEKGMNINSHALIGAPECFSKTVKLPSKKSIARRIADRVFGN